MWRLLCTVNSTGNKNPKYQSILSSFCKSNYTTEPPAIPAQADVVIIGGGVAGCNVLYQLSKRGVNAVLLERSRITSGTTWHTGGLCWSLRPNDTDIQLLASTRNLLEELGGADSGWTKTGGIFIAKTDERIEEYKRLHSLGHVFGINSQMISPNEASKLSPLLEPKHFKAALWSPGDGFADPSMFCSALVRAVNKTKVIENCPVTGIVAVDGAVKGVVTKWGQIRTGCVVNAAGIWAAQIAQMVGLDIPVSPMKHAYIVTNSTEANESIRGTPCIRDHDGGIYIRTQGESLILGGYENNPEVIKDIPEHFSFSLYDFNPNTFEVHMKNAIEICPVFEKIGVKSTVCGPEAFTPDHKPILGEDPKLRGFYHCSGFNSLGIQLSGGCAEQLAYWIVNGRPNLYMFAYDIRRFTSQLRTDRAWITETSHESYIKNYSIVYPHDQKLSGRNHRIDPFHEALVANGAVMEQIQGWERAGYFVKDRTAPVRGYDWYGSYDHVRNDDRRYEKEVQGDYTFGFSKHHDLIEVEALAARNNVALFDLSYFTKMYLTGPDAVTVADWLFTANCTDKECGSVVYTCCLNQKGFTEAEVTVTTLQEGVGTLVGPILKGKGFYIVAGGASGYHTISHIRKEMAKKKFKAHITDITNKLGILSIQGPKSGELLQSITETPITDEKFEVGMSHLIKINGMVCRAMRVSYIGELGYDLHIPYASCVSIFNKIVMAGQGFDLKHAGFRALYSLNLEKGYHVWGEDIRNDDNPLEAGMGSLCRQNGHYLGKAYIEKARQEGLQKRRVFLTLENPVAIHGLEPIWRNGDVVGYLRRGDYGYALGCSIGVGYVKAIDRNTILNDEYILNGDYEIEALGKKYPATVYLRSPFDPTHQRLLGRYEQHFEEQNMAED